MKNARMAFGVALVGATAVFAMAACSQPPTDPVPTPVAAVVAPTTPAFAAPLAAPPIIPRSAPTTPTTTKRPTTTMRPTTIPSVDASRCTNRIDYSNDPRSNALINSIGAETGRCPTPARVHQEGNDRTLVDDEHQRRDANGLTYAEYCRSVGYEPGPSCPAG